MPDANSNSPLPGAAPAVGVTVESKPKCSTTRNDGLLKISRMCRSTRVVDIAPIWLRMKHFDIETEPAKDPRSY